MRSFFNLTLLILLFTAFISVGSKKLIDSKIVYKEGSLNIVSCSLDTEREEVSQMNVESINIKVDLDVDKFYYPCNVGPDASNEEVETYKRLSRSAAKNYFKQKNSLIVNGMEVDGFLTKYISSYAPIVEYEFSKENYLKYGKGVLTEISSNNRVSCVVVSGTERLNSTPQMTAALNKVGALNDYNTMNYTGDGVTVGILETGVVDESHSNFLITDLQVRDELLFFETVSEHATQVASIIGGENGIAAYSTLLSVQTFGNSLAGEIDWMLDRNVDIINMSYGVNDETLGYYSDESAYMDYIAYTYNVTFIAASGNNDDGQHLVANPGLGYNVLTVGCTTSADVVSGFSSYITRELTYKPDLVVPGSDIGIAGFSSTHSGTSYSAAIMSGLTALLMERYPTLKVRPAMVKALACGSAKYIGTLYSEYNGYDNLAGAGRVQYNVMVNDYDFFTRHLTSSSTSSSIVFRDTQKYYNGETMQICLSWLVSSDGTTESLDFNNYYIRVVNSAGDLIHQAYSPSSNTLFIRYNITSTENYTVTVYRETAGSEMLNPNGEYLALNSRM